MRRSALSGRLIWILPIVEGENDALQHDLIGDALADDRKVPDG
jgi:hypothetical protein